jgi:4-amino-4-deoxy-L-arabinose transferase-like glycosyltransferase
MLKYEVSMKTSRELLLVAVIVATALFFRTYQLHSIPPGLYPDEAHNGNNATVAWEQKDWKVFYPENNGREGLFINLQSISVHFFGHSAWSLRIVSAIFGTLTVLGLYLLVRRLMNWQIAAIAAFLMATAFWHVLFSRIGFRAIMAPFLVVWGLYFLWRGIGTARIWDFVASGVCWGLGMYTYIGFRVMPAIVVAVLLTYWHFVKKDFGHFKYIHTRNELIRGFAAVMVTAILIAIPLGWHFYTHPDEFLGRTSQVSIFSASNPILALTINTVKTLGMFSFVGDFNGRHNLAGDPQLYWPVGAFFLIGFVRSIIKVRKSWKIHGHASTVHVLLLSWFGLALFPVVFSNEGLPHALRAIIAAPVVYIFAAEGIWWLYELIEAWYRLRDMHFITQRLPVRHQPIHESTVVGAIVIIALLGAIAAHDFHKYFVTWAQAPITKASYNYSDTELANRLNTAPQKTPKYVVVPINYQPTFSTWEIQSVMFLTDTATPEKQHAKNIYYITQHDYALHNYNRAGMIFKLYE